MRISAFLFFLFFLNNCIRGQIANNLTVVALNNLQKGYVETAFDELKKSADFNDVVAQYYMAICYEQGLFVQKNVAEAFKMYRKTAERGLPDAMYKLACFYKEGIAVNADEGKSLEWNKRFQNKGGKLTLPDFVGIYNQGVIAAAQLPSKKQDELAANNNANINVNSTIASNNQTINNITIVQAASTQPVVAQQPTVQPKEEKNKSEVDLNIPSFGGTNDHTFAVIICNENYQDVAKVPNALNDGQVFAEYCHKTLGLPQTNIHLVKDATLNNMKREISWLSQVTAAYKGEAKVIFYYAGHGIPDEKTKAAYLLPVDGFGTDVSTGYSLNDLYSTLGKLQTEQTVVLLDACFSGSLRGEGMLASARGIAIKPKRETPQGQMVVLSAAQGDETAYPYTEQGHGLFTYYLLKKLQETKGTASLGEISSYVIDNVSKKSIVVNGKSQTPCVSAPVSIGDNWKNWKLK